MSGMILTSLPSGMLTVTAVHLYPTAARDGDPEVVPATLTGGKVVISPDATTEGRWYPVIVGTVANSVAHQVATPPYVDLPDDPSLIISPEVIAARAGIPLPLTDDQRETLTEAILDAQSDVSAYLGVPLTPEVFVQRDLWPDRDQWTLTAHGDLDIVGVLSADPQMFAGAPTGYFTVTYAAGLDARNDSLLRPIRRYVRAHAMNSPEVVRAWKVAVNPSGEIRSLSAEGQSVSFTAPTLGGGTGKAGSGEPGTLPTLGSLDQWRVAGRRVHQGPTHYGEWPYTSPRWP